MTENMDSEDVYELFQQGRAHMERGDNAQATVPLEKAKRREPDKASIREALGHYKMALWLRPEVSYYQQAVDGLLD